MISSTPDNMLTLYYRGPDALQPIRILSRTDAAEVVARLGGDGAEREKRLDFSYSEIVAILQGLVDQGKLVASASGKQQVAMLVLQDVSHLQEAVYGAPVIATEPSHAGRSLDDLPMLQSDVTDDAAVTTENRRSRPQ